MKYNIQAMSILLKQKEKEIEKYRNSENEGSLKRLRQLELDLQYVRKYIKHFCIMPDCSLNEIGMKLLKSEGTMKDIYKDLFTYRVINSSEPADVNIISNVINELDLEHLQDIIRSKPETIYGVFADRRYTEIIFEVDQEVKQELKIKIKKDQRSS